MQVPSVHYAKIMSAAWKICGYISFFSCSKKLTIYSSSILVQNYCITKMTYRDLFSIYLFLLSELMSYERAQKILDQSVEIMIQSKTYPAKKHTKNMEKKI